MRLFVILSDGDTWDGLDGCKVVLAKEEHELTDDEIGIEYNPKNHVMKSESLESLSGELFSDDKRECECNINCCCGVV